MKRKGKIAVALLIAAGLVYTVTSNLPGLRAEAAWRWQAAKIVSNESNITSVGLKIDTGDKQATEVEMYPGASGLLQGTIETTSATADKTLVYSYDNGQYLQGEEGNKIDSKGSFKLTKDAKVGEVVTFTVTSKEDSSKSAQAKVKIVERPVLKAVKIGAPEGYELKEEDGKNVIEVPLGVTEITLVDKTEYSANYPWKGSWGIGKTRNKDGNLQGRLLQIDKASGKITIQAGVEEGYYADASLSPEDRESYGDNVPSAKVRIRIVNGNNESNITSVGLKIDTGDKKETEVEMYPGARGMLQGTIETTSETADKTLVYSYDNGQYLQGEEGKKIDSKGSFRLTADAKVGEEITFTATSQADPNKSATAKIRIVEKPILRKIEIGLPDGYTLNSEGKLEVTVGTTELQFIDKPDKTDTFEWDPDWSIGDIYDEKTLEDIEDRSIISVDQKGKVSISPDIKEGTIANLLLRQKNNDSVRAAAVALKFVKAKGTLTGISIKAPEGYEINQDGIIEVYPDTKLTLNGIPEKTEGFVWKPNWEAGPTYDASGKEKKLPPISVNASNGEVTVASYAEEGDYADIKLTQQGDDSISASVRIKVKYWNLTVSTRPENLIDSNARVDPTRQNKGEIVQLYSAYRGVTDSQGQKYIFDHWETDDANKDLTNMHWGGTVNGSTASDAFRMPARDVHLTAVFEKSWDVKEELTGGGNMPPLLNNITNYKAGTKVALSYYKIFLSARNLELQSIRVTNHKGEEIPSVVDESSSDDIVHIYFTMPAEEVTVAVNVARDPDADKSMRIGEVAGTLVSGTAGTASAEVTASGYPDGEVLTVGESYADADGTLKNESNRTAGLNFTVSSVTGEKAQVTIQTDDTVPAGKYNFTVISSNGKKRVTGVVEVKAAEAKALTVKGTLIELEEDATGELTLKGTSLNLKNGTAVKAIETDAKGTEKNFGKTEGLVFDNAAIVDNAFTMKAHLSKTVAAGTYYFKVQAGDTVSEVASIVVTRTKKEEPTPPVEEKEYSINASCNPNQGSIEIRVNGTEARKAKKGDKVTLTAVAKSGYKLKNWSLNMDMTTITPSEGTLTDTTVSFLMPKGTMTVGAAFESTGSENPDTPTSTAPTITAFVVANVNGVIDQSNGQITVVVPNGTDVTALKPAVAVSDRASVTPNSGAAVNFTDAVVYTVTSASGETKQYVVTVKVQEASVSDSLWDQITNPEGDRSWWKKADSIKSHKKNKYPKYW